MTSRRWLLALPLVCACGARTGLHVDPPPPPCATDADCDDGVFCNGAETCREEHCISGAPLVCLGSTDCVTNACDETARACVRTYATPDADHDGYRAPLAGHRPGSPGSCGDDCDDHAATVHPGAMEVCNGVDDDCNGIIDDGATLTPTGDAVRVSEDAVAPSGPGGVQWTGDHYGISYWGYAESQSHVYFRTIDRSGAPSSTQQQLSTTPNDAFGASLVWNGSVLGAVWQDRRDPMGGYEIYFNRLTPTGERLGPDERISFAPGFSVNPAIAWTGSEFLIVWQDERDALSSGNYAIYGQRLDANGRLILANQRLTRLAGTSEGPSIAVNDTGVALAFMNERNGRRAISFGTMGLDLTARLAPVQISPPSQNAVGVTVVWNRDRWVAAWYDDDPASPDHEVWGASRNADGTAHTVALRLTMDPNFSRYPSLLPLGDRLLMTWADDRDGGAYTIWGRLLTADLAPLGPESRVTRTSMGMSAGVDPLLARGPDGDVGVLYRDQQGGRIQAWFTRLQCAIPR